MEMARENMCHPFVKWAGGKRQLIGEIEKSLPEDFREREITYIEPFVGGGAVLFHMLQEYPNIRHAVINDINKSLVTAYMVVRDDVEGLIRALREMAEEYMPLSPEERKEYFHYARKRYNECKDREGSEGVGIAAMFIFLNRTCFNGLYRENRKGEFNVPFGGYGNPGILDEDNLRRCSALLRKCSTHIICGDFEDAACLSGGSGTLYYLDPPYRAITETSAFNTYSKEGFGDGEQERLCRFCRRIDESGGMFIESNSDSGRFFDELYDGFDIRRVAATRRINSKGDRRGKISELIITNIKNNGNNDILGCQVAY